MQETFSIDRFGAFLIKQNFCMTKHLLEQIDGQKYFLGPPWYSNRRQG